MPLNFHAGLPGPFSYTRRLAGGRKGGSGGGGGGLVLAAVVVLVLVVLAIEYWYVTLPMLAVGGLLAWYHFANLEPEDQAEDEAAE